MEILHNLFHWLQYNWGVDHTEYGRSYSAALLESLNFWGVLEGTHLLTLILFFGTIFVVDMRLLGVSFRKTPISVVSERLLPLTVISMTLVILSGILLFFSKPDIYWHSVWFRTKMILLVVAIANITIFHFVFQKDQIKWDTDESPPLKAKLSGAISLLSWILIITCGRFIAYNWYDCGKPLQPWMNAYAECALTEKGAINIGDYDPNAVTEDTVQEDAPAAPLPDLPPPDAGAAPDAAAPAADAAAQPEAK